MCQGRLSDDDFAANDRQNGRPIQPNLEAAFARPDGPETKGRGAVNEVDAPVSLRKPADSGRGIGADRPPRLGDVDRA
jgi:hypothetical protein